MRVTARYERRSISEEEMRKATPTLIGKPVTVNFKDPRIGTVIDAQFNNNGIDLELDLWDAVGGFMYDPEEGNSFSNVAFTELSLVEVPLPRSSNQKVKNDAG